MFKLLGGEEYPKWLSVVSIPYEMFFRSLSGSVRHLSNGDLLSPWPSFPKALFPEPFLLMLDVSNSDESISRYSASVYLKLEGFDKISSYLTTRMFRDLDCFCTSFMVSCH